MNPLLHSLPLDRSGNAPTNRTTGEYHSLADQALFQYRVVVLDHGYFYVNDTLQITDGTGYTLKPELDYQCTGVHAELTRETGLLVCSVIVIQNTNVHHDLYVDAPMVGGEYRQLAPAIVQMARGLLNNTRKVNWKNIHNKPDAFAPNGHLHALWELYGFTQPTLALKRIQAALEINIQTDYDILYSGFEAEMQRVEGDLAQVEQRLTTHINNRNNPHTNTKAQVGLTQLNNYAVATEAQARQPNGDILNAFTTPLRAAQAIQTNFGDHLTAHTTNTNNPHNNTTTQLGIYTSAEFDAIAANYYDRGETVDASSKLDAKTFEALRAEAWLNNTVLNFTTGRFAHKHFANATGDANKIYAGDGNWISLESIFSQFGTKGTPFYSMAGNWPRDASPKNTVMANYSNAAAFPIGTMVVFRMSYNFVHGTGNGAISTNVKSLGIARRVGNGYSEWVFAGV